MEITPSALNYTALASFVERLLARDEDAAVKESLIKTEAIVLTTPRLIHPHRYPGSGESDRKRIEGVHQELENRSKKADRSLGSSALKLAPEPIESGQPGVLVLRPMFECLDLQ